LVEESVENDKGIWLDVSQSHNFEAILKEMDKEEAERYS
jgi:hypothetical protein